MKKALQVFSAVVCLAAAIGAADAQTPLMDAQGAAAEGLMQQEPIAGSVTRSDGAQAPQAAFSLFYELPQFEPRTEADEQINRYYQELAQGMEAAAQTLTEDGGDLRIAFEVTHNTARYVSVAVSRISQGGNAENEVLSADTFARDGVYAGQPLSLSQVLGLEEGPSFSGEETLAETLAYKLIWQMVQQEMQNIDSDFLDGLTEQNVRRALIPETDFYLDAEGNIVFFIQAGEVAGEIAGILRFPFSPAELLSAL